MNAKFGAAGQLNNLPRGGLDLRTLLRGGDSDFYEWFNLTANPKAVKTLAGSIRFRDGGMAATVAVTFDPSQKSTLLDFLSGPSMRMELLHHAPRPATYAIGLSLPEKNRAAVVIEFLDAIAKSTGASSAGSLTMW